jgi:hypothetical protein
MTAFMFRIKATSTHYCGSKTDFSNFPGSELQHQKMSTLDESCIQESPSAQNILQGSLNLQQCFSAEGVHSKRQFRP